MAVRGAQQRSFLFLQGLATPFWLKLARAVEARGHSVRRINLCGADRIFWPRLGTFDYRGRFADWREYLGAFLHDHGVSDIVVFGDCRPYHRVAIDLARSRGIAVHVFEEGYFRPDWITLERNGTNAFSSLPRDPERIVEAAAREPEEALPAAVSGGFARRVRWEILGQLATLAMTPLYPRYRRHRSRHPLSEMTGWLRRLAVRPVERRNAARVTSRLHDEGRPFYLLPLQLESDYQIRRHSPFGSMAHVMEIVLGSFARGAPQDALLVMKLHPLDNGLVGFRRHAKQIAERHGLADRVVFIDGGHLPTLLSMTRGVVVVNSTAGLSALHHNRPVTVLGDAIFDIDGLTFKGHLDRFWTEGTPPDQHLFHAFRQLVLSQAQLNGSFFTDAGMALAVDGALQRMDVAPVAAPAPARVDPAPAALPEAAPRGLVPQRSRALP